MPNPCLDPNAPGLSEGARAALRQFADSKRGLEGTVGKIEDARRMHEDVARDAAETKEAYRLRELRLRLHKHLLEEEERTSRDPTLSVRYAAQSSPDRGGAPQPASSAAGSATPRCSAPPVMDATANGGIVSAGASRAWSDARGLVADTSTRQEVSANVSGHLSDAASVAAQRVSQASDVFDNFSMALSRGDADAAAVAAADDGEAEEAEESSMADRVRSGLAAGSSWIGRRRSSGALLPRDGGAVRDRLAESGLVPPRWATGDASPANGSFSGSFGGVTLAVPDTYPGADAVGNGASRLRSVAFGLMHSATGEAGHGDSGEEENGRPSAAADKAKSAGSAVKSKFNSALGTIGAARRSLFKLPVEDPAASIPIEEAVPEEKSKAAGPAAAAAQALFQGAARSAAKKATPMFEHAMDQVMAARQNQRRSSPPPLESPNNSFARVPHSSFRAPPPADDDDDDDGAEEDGGSVATDDVVGTPPAAAAVAAAESAFGRLSDRAAHAMEDRGVDSRPMAKAAHDGMSALLHAASSAASAHARRGGRRTPSPSPSPSRAGSRQSSRAPSDVDDDDGNATDGTESVQELGSTQRYSSQAVPPLHHPAPTKADALNAPPSSPPRKGRASLGADDVALSPLTPAGGGDRLSTTPHVPAQQSGGRTKSPVSGQPPLAPAPSRAVVGHRRTNSTQSNRSAFDSDEYDADDPMGPRQPTSQLLMSAALNTLNQLSRGPSRHASRNASRNATPVDDDDTDSGRRFASPNKGPHPSAAAGSRRASHMPPPPLTGAMSGSYGPPVRSRAGSGASVASVDAPQPGLVSTVSAVVDALRVSPQHRHGTSERSATPIGDTASVSAGSVGAASQQPPPPPPPQQPLDPTLGEARRQATLFDVLLRLRRSPSIFRSWKRRHVCLVGHWLYMYRESAVLSDKAIESYDLTKMKGEVAAEPVHGQSHTIVLRPVPGQQQPTAGARANEGVDPAAPVMFACLNDNDELKWARAIKAAQRVAEARATANSAVSRVREALPAGYSRHHDHADDIDDVSDKELLHRIADAVTFFEPQRAETLPRMMPLFKGRERDVLQQSYKKHGGPPPSNENRVKVFCQRFCPQETDKALSQLRETPRGQEYAKVIKPLAQRFNNGKEY